MGVRSCPVRDRGVEQVEQCAGATHVGQDRRTISGIALLQGGLFTVRKALAEQVVVVHDGASQRTQETVAGTDEQTFSRC